MVLYIDKIYWNVILGKIQKSVFGKLTTAFVFKEQAEMFHSLSYLLPSDCKNLEKSNNGMSFSIAKFHQYFRFLKKLYFRVMCSYHSGLCFSIGISYLVFDTLAILLACSLGTLFPAK